MTRLSTFVAISAVTTLALAGFTSLGSAAAEHHVKLTGVVSGTVACTVDGLPENCTKISIQKGKKGKKAGKWTLGPATCGGIGPSSVCTAKGHGKMRTGKLKGKVALNVKCKETSKTGTLSQPGKPAERMRFANCPSATTKGSTFKFTLTY